MLYRLVAIVCFPIMIGCGGGASDEPLTVPVSGKVILNGQPLAGAKVYFANPKMTGVGITDEEGNYSLNKGAIPGENMVYITKIEGEGSADSAMDAEQLMAANAGAANTEKPSQEIKEVVPEKYSNPEKSELKFTVSNDGNDDANFTLE